MRSIEVVFRELLVVFSAGAIPSLLAYHTGGAEQLILFVKAVVPSKELLGYSLGLFAVFALVAYLERFLWLRTEAQRRRWAFARLTLKDIGNGLLGLWRVMAGMFLCLPFVWLWVEYETWTLPKVGEFWLLGLALFAECCVLAEWGRKLELLSLRRDMR
ncbi:hypothetical protein D0A22_03240 [Stutzerimonas stutzeri]|nr:hypothetical protein D0A22_03240 [Stutzerimonas stutzeri]